jgi:hypothetical protein
MIPRQQTAPIGLGAIPKFIPRQKSAWRRSAPRFPQLRFHRTATSSPQRLFGLRDTGIMASTEYTYRDSMIGWPRSRIAATRNDGMLWIVQLLTNT